ncbi:MAG TPA: hypothetical protein VEU08_02585 [Vicinamibacterales bacterium]|nr:hypothetical protein [Vicinamibacterales bacterium]
MNRVTFNCGPLATVTLNVHVDFRCIASVAVQVTVVTPAGNADPLRGVHAVVTGAVPCTTVGVPNATAVGDAAPVIDTAAGQVMTGGSLCVGGMGLALLQAAVTPAARNAALNLCNNEV